jgi:predicted alpha/beta-hydrolase family hydrolase
MARLRVDGLFFLGFPLHPPDKPKDLDAEVLYRVIAPMLFVQGTRDRNCDLDVLRKTLARVGAPKTLHVVAEADHALKVLKKSGRTQEAVIDETLATLQGWIQKVIGA